MRKEMVPVAPSYLAPPDWIAQSLKSACVTAYSLSRQAPHGKAC